MEEISHRTSRLSIKVHMQVEVRVMQTEDAPAEKDLLKSSQTVFDSMKMLPDWMPEGVIRIAGEVNNADIFQNGIRIPMARRRGPK
jgi:hypothetical protein